MGLAAKAVNLRAVNKGTLKAFFSVLVGYESTDGFVPVIKINDVALRDGTKGPWVAWPSKPRMKDGEQVLREDGSKQYDDIVALFGEKKDDKFLRTKEAFAFGDDIAAQAEALLKSDTAATSGRGAAKEPTKAGTSKKAAPIAAEEDDDLPF